MYSNDNILSVGRKDRDLSNDLIPKILEKFREEGKTHIFITNSEWLTRNIIDDSFFEDFSIKEYKYNEYQAHKINPLFGDLKAARDHIIDIFSDYPDGYADYLEDPDIFSTAALINRDELRIIEYTIYILRETFEGYEMNLYDIYGFLTRDYERELILDKFIERHYEDPVMAREQKRIHDYFRDNFKGDSLIYKISDLIKNLRPLFENNYLNHIFNYKDSKLESLDFDKILDSGGRYIINISDVLEEDELEILNKIIIKSLLRKREERILDPEDRNIIYLDDPDNLVDWIERPEMVFNYVIKYE